MGLVNNKILEEKLHKEIDELLSRKDASSDEVQEIVIKLVRQLEEITVPEEGRKLTKEYADFLAVESIDIHQK